MGEDKKITVDDLQEELPEVVPKHLKKYSDKESRKEWLRNYHREYYRRKKSPNKEKYVKGETVAKKQEQDAQMNNMLGESNIGQMVLAVKDMIGDKNDPVVKAIDKYGKFVPLAVGFLKGFADAAARHNANNSQRSAPQQQIKPPDGWLSLGPIQKLNKKYTPTGEISSWYKQGLAYDSFVEGGEFQGVSNSPVEMQQTVHGQSNSMQDLIRRSNAPVGERVDNSSMPDVPVVERKDGKPSTIEEAQKKSSGEKPSEDIKEDARPSEMLESEQKDVIIDIMANEVNMYADLVINYFKNRSLDQFENDLENADETVSKFMNGLGRFLPFQAKDLIRSTSFDQLYSMVAEADPKKIELIEKKDLKGKFEKMWLGLQERINK